MPFCLKKQILKIQSFESQLWNYEEKNRGRRLIAKNIIITQEEFSHLSVAKRKKIPEHKLKKKKRKEKKENPNQIKNSKEEGNTEISFDVIKNKKF